MQLKLYSDLCIHMHVKPPLGSCLHMGVILCYSIGHPCGYKID